MAADEGGHRCERVPERSPPGPTGLTDESPDLWRSPCFCAFTHSLSPRYACSEAARPSATKRRAFRRMNARDERV